MPFISNPQKKSGKCFAVYEKNLLLKKDGSETSFFDLEDLKKRLPQADFFYDDEFFYSALSVSSAENIPEGYEIVPLRDYFAGNGEESSFYPFRARAVSSWREMTGYCSFCGAKLDDSKKFSARECPSCKKVFFPRISPCVIVAVHRENKILLAKHTYRNQDIYACIAGFMEAGESCEMAVRREVFEETGIKIKNVIYRGSQSWPFPDQLMLGFTADYESGEIKLQKKEIQDAQWFDIDALPQSPKKGSIAYRLIHGLY